MIDVFRIGVSIGLTNDVSPVIATIQRDLAGLGRTVDRTAAGFKALRLAATAALGGTGVAWAGIAAARAGSGAGHQAGMGAPALLGAASRAAPEAAVAHMAPEIARRAQAMVATPLPVPMLPIRHETAPLAAAGEAVNRGLRVPAATMPSLPTPAAGPWAPGLMPALP